MELNNNEQTKETRTFLQFFVNKKALSFRNYKNQEN